MANRLVAFALALRERWSGFDLPTRATLIMLAAHLVLRCWQLFPGNYWQDDFVLLADSRDQLDWQSAWGAHNGHIMPIGRVLTTLVAALPGSFLPAASVILVLQTVTSLVGVLLLRRLTRGSVGYLIGVAVLLFSPLVVPAVTWWSAFLITIPVQTAMVLSGYAQLRLITGRWMWGFGVLGGLALGLAFTEKAVVVAPFCAALVVLHSATWSEFKAALRRSLWVWAVLAGAVIGYLVVYRTAVGLGTGQVESPAAFFRLLWQQGANTFVVGGFGGPWRTLALTPTSWPGVSVVTGVVVAQLAVAALYVSWRLTRWRGVIAWSVMAAYLLLEISITAAGRGQWGELIATDPRYLVDAVVVLACVVAVAFGGDPVAARLPAVVSQRWTAVMVAACLVYFNSAMVTHGSRTPAFWHDEVGTYVKNARTSLAANPNAALVDGVVPGGIMLPLFDLPDRRVSNVLAAYDVHPRFNVTANDLRMLDDAGSARRPRLIFGTQNRTTEGNGCAVTVRSTETRAVQLTRFVPRAEQLLQLDFRAVGEGEAQLTLGANTESFAFESGTNSVYVLVDGGFGTVHVSVVRGFAEMCVRSVSVGFPVPDLEAQ